MTQIKYYCAMLGLMHSLMLLGQTDQPQYSAFVPSQQVVVKSWVGDLNQDGVADCVLLTKGTQKDLIAYERGQKIDHNRRGMIVLFNKAGHFVQVLKNLSCFSGENDNDSHATELDVAIDQGNLEVQFSSGASGHWKYTFRYQYADFELIAYEAVERVTLAESNYSAYNKTSINYITQTKVSRKFVGVNRKRSERYQVTTENIQVGARIKLSEISDFDSL